MAWLANIQVNISSTDVTHYGVSYCITMYAESNTSSNNESPLPEATKTIIKSYREFRGFRRMLLSNTSPTKLAKGITCSCCANCPFLSLYWFIKGFDFPKRNPFLQYRKKSMDSRRRGLEEFLMIIFSRLSSLPSPILRICQVRNCLILRMISHFIDFEDWELSPIKQNLSLEGWRSSFIHSLSLRGSVLDTPPVNEENTFSLPKLHIRSARIVKHDNILENIRYQLIASHEQEFPELMNNNISDCRLWEIALYIAAKIGNEYATRMVLTQGVSVDSFMSDGTTSLNIASRMGHESIVSILLEAGADPNFANKFGITPLVAACRNGRNQIVAILLAYNADINLCSNRGTHPIHAAVVSKSVDTVLLLISRGSSVEVTTNNGTTPLHFAAKLGLASITELLLSNGADVNVLTRNGSTPLSIAAANDHHDVVLVLLSHGVDSTVRQSTASCTSLEDNRATPRDIAKYVCVLEPHISKTTTTTT